MKEPKRVRGNILAVDGDTQALQDLSTLLASEGYRVQALSADPDLPGEVEQQATDLILLGAPQPGFDSLKICQHVKADRRTSHIPVLFVCDRDTQADLPSLFAAGAADCLVQPLGTEQVLARIRTLLALSAASRQVADLESQLEKEIATRLQAEVAIHEAEQSGQSLIQSLNEVIYTADQDGVLTYVSPAITRLLGYHPDEATGRRLGDFVHAQDSARFREALEAIGQDHRTAVQLRFVTKAGEGRWVHTSSQPISIGHRVLGFQGSLTDVTEQRKAAETIEQQADFLTSVLESLTHPFYVVNVEDYTIEIANTAARQESLEGETTCYALTHKGSLPCDSAEHPCPLEMIKATKQPVTVQHVHYDAQGQVHYVEVRGYPLLDAKGEVTRVIEYALDVTDRQQAEEALRKREEEYRQLLEALQEGIWVIDQDALTTFVNPRMAHMLGYTVEEMQGKHLFSFMDEQGVAIAERNLERRRQGIREQHDFEFLRKDGSRIYTLLETSPIYDDDGHYAGGIAGIQDITERRRTREALRRSEALLRETQQMARVGGWELDLQSSDVTWTEEVHRIHEVPLDFQPTVETALAFYHPEDRPVLEEAIQHAIEEGEPWDLELRFFTANGQPLWVRAIGKAELSNGKAVRLSGTFQDVTERKQAELALREGEARWRSVTENSPDHVILLDTDLNIEFVNYASPGLTVSDLIGTPLYAYVQEERQPEIKRILERVLQTGEPSSYETEFETPDGDTIYYDSRVVPRLLDHQIAGLAVNARDVTAFKRAEQALREAIKTAEEAKLAEEVRRQEADQRRQVAESLAGVLAALNSNQPLDQVLNHIADEARARLDNQVVAFYLVDSRSGKVMLQAAQGSAAEDVLVPPLPPAEEALRQAVDRCQPVMIPDLGEMRPSEAFPLAEAESESRPPQALLVMPVMVKDEVYGGLLLGRREPHTFASDEVRLAAAFADQIALAIENSRLRDQLEQAAAAAERSRLARDLHDSVTQALFSASLVAEVLPQVWRRDPDEAMEGLEELRLLTRGALAEMRTLLLELRPAALMETKLNDLLWQLTEAITSRARLTVTFDIEPIPALPPEVHVTFYRVAQEALHNVVKHADARHVTVSLRASPPLESTEPDHWQGQIVLHIKDDGQGFDPEKTTPDQLGLAIMRERADSVGAMLSAQSRPGRETQITLVWQLK